METIELAAPFFIKRCVALSHYDLCRIAYSIQINKDYSTQFLRDLRSMVDREELVVSNAVNSVKRKADTIRDTRLTKKSSMEGKRAVGWLETGHQTLATMEDRLSNSGSCGRSDQAVRAEGFEVQETEPEKPGVEETTTFRSQSQKQHGSMDDERRITKMIKPKAMKMFVERQLASIPENEAKETDHVRGERLRQQLQSKLNDSVSKFPGSPLRRMQQKLITYPEPRKLLVDESVATDYREPYYSMVTMEETWSSSGSSIRSDEAVYRMMNEAKERESVESHERQRQRVIERFLKEPPPRKFDRPVSEIAPDLTKALETPGPPTLSPSTLDPSTPSASYHFPKHAKNFQAHNPYDEQKALDPFQSVIPAISDYKVGWICALPFEAAAAEVMLDEQYDRYDSSPYTLGRTGSHKVVIACLPAGRLGTSAATAVARGMVEKFRGIRFGFMVGIGGGLPSDKDDIRLGDVVVSSPHLDHGGVVQYDFGKAEEGGMFRRTGYLNSPPTFLLNGINSVRTNHERSRRTHPTHMARYVEESMEEYTLPQNERDILFNANYPHTGGFDCGSCDTNQIVNRGARNTKNSPVRIHYGTIASGNQVIKDAQTRDRIVKDLGGQVLCFEMEAAGLMNDFPCLVIRGISDYCDSHKNDGWQRYAAASAAAYTRELLLSMPSEDMA